MKTFRVKLKGVTPIMHHRMTEEALFQLLGSKSKKKKDKTEETPREIAERHAYKTKDGHYYIPLSYISGAFAHVSGDYKQASSSRKSIKSIAGGVFRPLGEAAILNDETGKPLKTFEVDIRKATNHLKGAIAVCRPRFDEWTTEFDVMVNTDLLNEDTALQILNDAGLRAGIGSFRVAKSGYFGQFAVTSWEPIQ